MSEPLWTTRPRQGHDLHRICAFQACFPPQLPAYWLDRYPEAEVVLDPFCGRGTVLLEGVLRGRKVIGFDLLSVALALSEVKVRCAPKADVLAEIDALDLDLPVPNLPADFVPLYHEETWQQVWNLREAARSPTLTALCLGRLHGHSPGFFSGTTFNVISLPSKRIAALNEKHGTVPPPRDVKKILRRAAEKFLPEEPLVGRGVVRRADARVMPIRRPGVDLVVTSPPFLAVVDYAGVNWLRQWFLKADGTGALPLVTNDKGVYYTFLSDVLREIRRVLRTGGTCIFEVGNEELQAMVLAAAGGTFGFASVVEFDFAGHGVSKIARAMRSGEARGQETRFTSNRCVVLA